ncbi:aldo/keto reductase [bacterium]|nr:aldo/keto reductase [bacterium]
MISETRYDNMKYNHCGQSGLKLPAVSLGLWHNWGDNDSFEMATQMVLKAFNLGITHFDLANNYGPPPGAAERNFGRILKKQLGSYRDELIISSKAGYDMWSGPYGNWGSRKSLLASLDQSLKRIGIDYVDIFYHHRPDPETPLEETMMALDQAVKSGKALYVGVSRYSPLQTKKAASILKSQGTPFIIHQPRYNLFEREPENGLFETLTEERIGCIVFSPLAQGLLTAKYLSGIPADSRASKPGQFLTTDSITSEKLDIVKRLNQIALVRDQSLAQMSIQWVLRQEAVTSALIGASKPTQVEEIVRILDYPEFTQEELKQIDDIVPCLVET